MKASRKWWKQKWWKGDFMKASRKRQKENADLPSRPCCTPAVSLIPEKSSSQMLFFSFLKQFFILFSLKFESNNYFFLLQLFQRFAYSWKILISDAFFLFSDVYCCPEINLVDISDPNWNVKTTYFKTVFFLRQPFSILYCHFAWIHFFSPDYVLKQSKRR